MLNSAVPAKDLRALFSLTPERRGGGLAEGREPPRARLFKPPRCRGPGKMRGRKCEAKEMKLEVETAGEGCRAGGGAWACLRFVCGRWGGGGAGGPARERSPGPSGGGVGAGRPGRGRRAGVSVLLRVEARSLPSAPRGPGADLVLSLDRSPSPGRNRVPVAFGPAAASLGPKTGDARKRLEPRAERADGVERLGFTPWLF